MFIAIDASKTTTTQKTGIDNTAFQIIKALNLIQPEADKYYLYTNKPLHKSLLINKKFKERLIPFPKFWNKIRLPLALLKDKPDIFLELAYTLPPITPKNSVILIHDLAFKLFPEAYSRSGLYSQNNTIKNALKKAKKIIVTTEASKKDLSRFYKNVKNNIEVIPLSYNEDLYKKIEYKKNILKFENPYFLYVGRLEKRKNIENIVKSFEIYKNHYNNDFKLVLCGKPGFKFNQIQEKINLSSYKKDIIMPGYIKDEDMPQLYSNALALIFPSLYEGFGLPILEANACGTPVITSNIEILKEVAGYAALFVNPHDPNDIASKMFRMEDKVIRSSLIENGYENIKRFSWEKTAEQLDTLLNEIT